MQNLRNPQNRFFTNLLSICYEKYFSRFSKKKYVKLIQSSPHNIAYQQDFVCLNSWCLEEARTLCYLLWNPNIAFISDQNRILSLPTGTRFLIRFCSFWRMLYGFCNFWSFSRVFFFNSRHFPPPFRTTLKISNLLKMILENFRWFYCKWVLFNSFRIDIAAIFSR